MPKNAITLHNQHGAVLATMPTDQLLGSLSEDPFQKHPDVFEGVGDRYQAALMTQVNGLPDDATDGQIREIFKDAAIKADVINETKQLLLEKMTEELYKALQPLAADLAQQVIGDGKELDAFLQGLLSGAEIVMLQQIKAARTKAAAGADS